MNDLNKKNKLIQKIKENKKRLAIILFLVLANITVIAIASYLIILNSK